MFSWTPRRQVVLAALMAWTVALPAAPIAMADTHIQNYGAVGPHSLRDTLSNPGVTCKYVTTFADAGGWIGKLRRFYVKPPRVFGNSGTNSVGWVFQAERKAGTGSWQTTYLSPLEYGTATKTQPASFHTKTVRVYPPSDYQTIVYRYRIMVYMYWFYPDGEAGMSQHRVDYYLHTYEAGPIDGKGQCVANLIVGP